MHRPANILLGIIFYTAGIVASVYLFGPLSAPISAEFALSLIVFGTFFMSAAFFGRYGSVLMFFAGVMIGSYFSGNQGFVALSLVPLLIALDGGTAMGKIAYLDLVGKENMFDKKFVLAAYLIISIMAAFVTGFFIESLPATLL